MKKSKYIIFFVIALYSCTNSHQEREIFELKKENKLALQLIDSLKQIDASKFNEILFKESGKPIDTVLIKEYEAFLSYTKTEFWINLANNRISVLKVRAARQIVEEKLFGEWEWVETRFDWGEYISPETENMTRKIIINEDYSILYFKNGVKIKQDSFYITAMSFLPPKYDTFIHLINQNRTQAFKIEGTRNSLSLTFFEPWYWCQDCPCEVFKKITNK